MITEVYALHALLVALLGWALLVQGGRTRWLAPAVALGVAHHLTFVLLLPGVLYYLLFGQSSNQPTGNKTFWPRWWRAIGTLALGGLGGALLYLRTPLAAGYGAIPPPVNWGYARDWAGFWWLVSGSAYRGYLFNLPASEILNRVAAWAYTLTSQYTPVGLALALVGLAHWDQHQPKLRNLALFWVVPLSIYTISYNTRDSEIYLLPVAWLAALWLAEGLPAAVTWLAEHFQVDWLTPVVGAITVFCLLILIATRLPTLSLRHDQQAQDFLAAAVATVPPHSIVVTSADAETFAFWYAAWGTGELLQRVPDVTVVNYSLYQFPWYQRLMAQRYPNVPGSGESVEALLAQNKGVRPVFFSEKFTFVPAESLTPVGPLWQYKE